MSRLFALAMTHPQQHFGFKEPIARQIPRGALGWGLIALVCWVGCAGLYVAQITAAAPRSDRLERLQRQIESLQTDVTASEDQVARGSSMHALTERAQTLGLVSPTEVQYINPTGLAYVNH